MNITHDYRGERYTLCKGTVSHYYWKQNHMTFGRHDPQWMPAYSGASYAYRNSRAMADFIKLTGLTKAEFDMLAEIDDWRCSLRIEDEKVIVSLDWDETIISHKSTKRNKHDLNEAVNKWKKAHAPKEVAKPAATKVKKPKQPVTENHQRGRSYMRLGVKGSDVVAFHALYKSTNGLELVAAANRWVEERDPLNPDLADKIEVPEEFMYMAEPESMHIEADVRDPAQQKEFAGHVRDNFGGACALTGCTLVCEAAHIITFATGGKYATCNGLWLRVDLHRLFDAGHMAINPETLTAHFSDEAQECLEYLVLDGNKISTPKCAVTGLDARWQKFLQKSA